MIARFHISKTWCHDKGQIFLMIMDPRLIGGKAANCSPVVEAATLHDAGDWSCGCQRR